MQVTIYAVRQINVERSAIERIRKCREQDLCVACEQPLYGESVRGCHWKCYKATMRAIERGELTEEQRVREGKLLASRRAGRPPSNPVTIEARGGAA